MPRRFVTFCLTAVAAMLVGVPALAYEGQWHFGGGAGVASFPRSDSPLSPALGVHGAYELNDMFEARLELMGSEHEFYEGYKTRLYSAALGLTYKLDVIELVPYAGLLGGYYLFDGPAPYPIEPNPNRPLARRQELGISVPLGLDWALSRTFALGVQFRYHGFMSDPLGSLRDAPFFTGLLRAEYRLGW